MCGIYGQISLSDGIPSRTVGERATNTLVHRGPDEQGTWSNHQVFLGMRRLSIIDLAGGQQPIWNEDGTCCIVYNGELYNYRDLRPELENRGHRFQTQSDTEVILHAYEEWGPACLRRFNGMFAIAIWNQAQGSLFLARDRIGEKPLYYYQDRERLAFASEIKAILADRTVPRALNFRGMANFLAFGHALAPETIFQGIHKLLPGHYLLARDGEVRTVQYWDVGDDRPNADVGEIVSEAQASESVLALLDDSVRARMVADVPVGAFLSGGLDSSAIVALMKRHANGPVKTFSVGFTIGGTYNELADARRVADHLGTEHYELRLEHLDLVQTLRTLVYHYDEPFGDPAGFPLFILSRFAREHVKVALAGDGADELFGGYRRYAVDQLAPAYQRLPQFVTDSFVPQLTERLPRLRRLKQTVRTLKVSDPARRYAEWLVCFTPEMQVELLCRGPSAALAGHDPAADYPRYYNTLSSSAADHLNRLMYVDLKTWLVDSYMEKIDKATMAAGLEARLPFLDHRLVELAARIPGKYKIRGGATKRVLKQAVSSLIPDEVLRKRKQGFAVPSDPWFRGELKQFTFDVLLDPGTLRRGYFDAAVVERLWREHLEGRHVWDTHLWLLLVFELWHRIYLDGEAV